MNVDEIVEVDIVASQSSLAEAIGPRKFDYVIASHVIEHVPDVISWLEDIRSLLTPQGELRLVIPDRRFTFDHFRDETRLADLVDAYLRKAKAPLWRLTAPMRKLGRLIRSVASRD